MLYSMDCTWFSSDELTLKWIFERFSNDDEVFIKNLRFWGVSADP